MPLSDPDEAFLPRIHAIFYATFDTRHGPRLSLQVPEGLIQSRYDPPPDRTQRAPPTPLLSFDAVSDYVIPKTVLCNRLVICNTPRHKLAGFPVLIEDKRYPRNEFRFNFCFVFDRRADLSCYEPIVRKVGRVLMESEQESQFLSSPNPTPRIHPVLEQLYEDLNSYSETSIPLTPHTTLDLKIFPFYPNPSAVRDWDVPVALVDILNRLDPSSDPTMRLVVETIDGVRCVGRIAEDANVDLDWTRGCVEHLLYYQCIMLLDLFTYSNIYALTKSFQYLALDPVITSECGPYVTRPGHDPPPWADLLQLYTRLKPGKTVGDWMDECRIMESGGYQIDPRRFVSFGVIKGFLRRIERWPVLVPEEGDRTPSGRRSPTPTPRTRANPHTHTDPRSLLTRQLLAHPPPPPRSPSTSTTTRRSHSTATSVSISRSISPVSPSPSPSDLPPPPELATVLDGTRSGDELCWMFGVSWYEMERWFCVLGGLSLENGSDSGERNSKREVVKRPPRADFGKVKVVFR